MIATVEVARHGNRAVLINSTHRLGGMTSGGLGMTDGGSTETIRGLRREFYQRTLAWSVI
ncbi:MAG: FAD-dependent oxidoreductase [Prosthecobacter sp.]|nr:FAD-dependent oxidoreductase [Prosthecobacter sp.]